MALSGDVLYLVCDISGSMSENGKPLLLRGVAREIEQFIRLGYASCEIKLVFWNETAAICDWNPDDDFPEQMYNCRGRTNMAALRDMLEASNGKMILLTDGWWSKEDSQLFKRWKNSMMPDTLRIIKIGGDANPLLKGDDVFSSDNFFDALDGWLKIPANSTLDNEEDEW